MLKVMIDKADLAMADMLEDVLAAGGYQVCGIVRAVEVGLELAALYKPDFAVLDVQLPGGDRGTDIGEGLRRPGGPGNVMAKRAW
jgi:DNA-binding response OmpR family regulator